LKLVKSKDPTIPHPSLIRNWRKAERAVASGFPTPTPLSMRWVATTLRNWVLRSCTAEYTTYAKYPSGVLAGNPEGKKVDLIPATILAPGDDNVDDGEEE
jgi:hypothetical protein